MESLAIPTVIRARRAAARAVLVACLAVAATAVMVSPVFAADPSGRPRSRPTATLAPIATPTPTDGRRLADTGRTRTPATTLAAAPAPTDVLLYRSTAMVKQFTNYWCVPAATQSMVNLIMGTSDRTKATQQKIYDATRANNRYTYKTKGNDPAGWAWALRNYTGGLADYRDRSFTDKTASLAAIVESIDRTGAPVGVPVHDGTHAWVVLGYRAALDPAAPSDRSRRDILGFYVSGPLGSPSDPWPYKYLTEAQFRSEFTRYHEWQRSVVWEDTWVIISQ